MNIFYVKKTCFCHFIAYNELMIKISLSGLFFGTASYPSKVVHGPRQLSDFEFVFLEKGRATLLLGSDVHDLIAPCLFFMLPQRRHTVVWEDQSLHRYVHFDLNRKDAEVVKLLEACEAIPYLSLGEDDLVPPLMRYITGRMEQEELQASIEQSIVLLLQLYVSRESTAGSTLAQTWPKSLRDAFAHLEREWKTLPLRPVNDQALARAAGISVTHLIRLFNKNFERSPAKFLMELRLIQAAKWLGMEKGSTASIARCAGFQNPQHFSRKFKALYGLPPLRFKKAAMNGEDVFLPEKLRHRHHVCNMIFRSS